MGAALCLDAADLVCREPPPAVGEDDVVEALLEAAASRIVREGAKRMGDDGVRGRPWKCGLGRRGGGDLECILDFFCRIRVYFARQPVRHRNAVVD